MAMISLPVIVADEVAATPLVHDHLAQIRPGIPAQVVAVPVIVHRHGTVTVLLPPAPRNVNALHHNDLTLRDDDASPAAELDVAGDRPAMHHHTSLYRRLGTQRRCERTQ